jgi:hypothetical protein
MIKIAVLIAFIVCISSGETFSQEWIPVGVSLSYDTTYIRSFDGPTGDDNIKVAWEKIVSKNTSYFKHPRVSMKKKTTYGYQIQKIECDCTNMRKRILSISVYKIDGTALQTFQYANEPLEWIDVPPGSTGEAVVKKVCEIF